VTGASPFIPLLLFFLVWLAWAVFQTVQLNEETKTLRQLKTNQEQALQQAQRARQTLDVLAAETQKLADAGNPNAQRVIDGLRKRGITVNRPNPAAQPAK